MQRSRFAKVMVNQWLASQLSAGNIALQVNEDEVREQAIKAGLGIGVMFAHEAANYPGLVEAYPTRPEWIVPNWLVTHGDLHHSEKVQRFLWLLAEIV